MITVAVASYNHETYVAECLESIVTQCHRELELCWVDDCSTDNTYESVRSLIASPSVRERFCAIHLKRNTINRGAAFSLNLAARMGSGRLISFMNSDDFYGAERLATISGRYNEEVYWFCFTNVLPVDASGEPLVCDPTGERIAFDAELFINRFEGVSAALLHRQIGSSTGNFVVTRRLFEEVGGFQDLKYCHDWMFALQAALFCEPIFLSDRLYNYRLHRTNSFRALKDSAERETEIVLTEYFSQVALRPPLNKLAPCPRRQPAGFWSLVHCTRTKDFADRAFFPYSSDTRLLDRR